MEKIHENMHVFMLLCIKHACFRVFSPFSAYLFPHDIIAEKDPLIIIPVQFIGTSSRSRDDVGQPDTIV